MPFLKKLKEFIANHWKALAITALATTAFILGVVFAPYLLAFAAAVPFLAPVVASLMAITPVVLPVVVGLIATAVTVVIPSLFFATLNRVIDGTDLLMKKIFGKAEKPYEVIDGDSDDESIANGDKASHQTFSSESALFEEQNVLASSSSKASDESKAKDRFPLLGWLRRAPCSKRTSAETPASSQGDSLSSGSGSGSGFSSSPSYH